MCDKTGGQDRLYDVQRVSQLDDIFHGGVPWYRVSVSEPVQGDRGIGNACEEEGAWNENNTIASLVYEITAVYLSGGNNVRFVRSTPIDNSPQAHPPSK